MCLFVKIIHSCHKQCFRMNVEQHVLLPAGEMILDL